MGVVEEGNCTQRLCDDGTKTSLSMIAPHLPVRLRIRAVSSLRRLASLEMKARFVPKGEGLELSMVRSGFRHSEVHDIDLLPSFGSHYSDCDHSVKAIQIQIKA